jgi:hypothetical protein
MRIGHLQRDKDCSGISGVGRVAEVALFSDGQVVLRWISKTPSIAIYRSLDQMLAVHAHGDCTHVEWDDGMEPSRSCCKA